MTLTHGINYQTGEILGYVLGKILWLKIIKSYQEQ